MSEILLAVLTRWAVLLWNRFVSLTLHIQSFLPHLHRFHLAAFYLTGLPCVFIDQLCIRTTNIFRFCWSGSYLLLSKRVSGLRYV